MKGIINTQILKDDAEERERFQADCMKRVKKQLAELETEIKDKLREGREITLLSCLRSNLVFSPAMTAVKERFEANQQAISNLRIRVLEVADRYVGERIGRHIRCRSITSVGDICLTTSILNAQEYKDKGTDLFASWVSIQYAFMEAEEEERKRIADQLAEEATPSETSTSRSSADEEKERTRKANKAKQSKAQQKAEFERREIECAKIRAEQERKAKEAKRIAKAKKEKAKREAEGK